VKLDKLDDFLAEKAPKEAAKVVEAFAPIANSAPPKPAIGSDEFMEKLLTEGRAEFAAIMAS
jgi:hypothetical protein